MLRRALLPAFAIVLMAAPPSVAATAVVKWPPWLSIESPVNPFDQSARGAAFLIHAAIREGAVELSDVTATAEGLVNGVRKSVPIRIEAASRAGTFAVRKQWPAEGTWLVRVAFHSTTAIVRLGRDGSVAGVSVPTTAASDGMQLPRAVLPSEIDSILSAASKQ
jgi:hypothetical protein